MSNRLQVLLPSKEYRTLQAFAKKLGLSLGEWVRQTLYAELKSHSLKKPEEKLSAIRKYSSNNYPSGSIEQMNQEISQGYLQDDLP